MTGASASLLSFFVVCCLSAGAARAQTSFVDDRRTADERRSFIGAYIDIHYTFTADATPAEARRLIDHNLDRMAASGLNVIVPKCTSSDGGANFPSEIIRDMRHKDWDPLGYFIAGAPWAYLQPWLDKVDRAETIERFARQSE